MIVEPGALMVGIVLSIPRDQKPAAAASAMIPPLGLLTADIVAKINVFDPGGKIRLGIGPGSDFTAKGELTDRSFTAIRTV